MLISIDISDPRHINLCFMASLDGWQLTFIKKYIFFLSWLLTYLPFSPTTRFIRNASVATGMQRTYAPGVSRRVLPFSPAVVVLWLSSSYWWYWRTTDDIQPSPGTTQCNFYTHSLVYSKLEINKFYFTMELKKSISFNMSGYTSSIN